MAEPRWLERDGARIAYDVLPPRQALAGAPTLILGHSLLCDATMWAPVLDGLSQRHRVINVDARGHGRSRFVDGARRPFSLDDLAEDWRCILDAEGVQQAAVVGLSMGAMTGMRLALAHPARVRALVLLDTSADPELGRKRLRYWVMLQIWQRLGRLRLLDGPVRVVFFARKTLRERPAVADARMAAIWGCAPEDLAPGIHAVMRRGPLAERLGAIRCPTLVLCGDDDRATPPFRGRRIAERIAGARFALIPGAGHLSTLEAPDAVLAEVLPFLAGLAL